ncbi:MAG: nitronate monooxygenase [Firmicutes bacterium]|nr:nitronate monooxygenase [Bacillota bacterium]
MKGLNEILGIKYPIMQGGMANISTGEFAAAVSNAGALGIIGAGGMTAEQLQAEIGRCRQMTERPFGVNIMLMNPEADKMAQLVINEGVPVVTTGAGNPGKYMAAWKAAGIKVFPVVSASSLAKRLVSAGADGVIAEGCESGGHIGELTTMALVPQVAAAVGPEVPVIVAGGIAGGRQLAAAFALGGCGVQVGTCLLVSQECPIHENYKRALLKARDNDTTVTGRSAGAPVRILKNAMSREYLRMEKEGADVVELEKFTLGSLRRAVHEGDVKNGSLMAGQVAGMLGEIRPLSEIFDTMMRQCSQTIGQLAAINEEVRGEI